ncbi:MAG: ABC transporter permease, partial [Planctomycetota bacterium]|nr:ABC transporter permease [Planctomycetota bacterium]
ALGAGIWLAALNVRYRDVQHALPLLIRLWMFLSPIAYPLRDLQTKALPACPWLFDLNPLSGVVEGFRWSLFAIREPFPWQTFLIGTLVALALFLAGIKYFQRVEREFADWL